MVDTLPADASPEKRLFIHLLTRDITMVAAFLDLIDNSINAAISPMASVLRTASDYQKLLKRKDVEPNVSIALNVNGDTIQVSDTASGISAETAKKYVFKFGRKVDPSHSDDRLSVYGIGLKRALFKLGNKVAITSDHVDGGFELDLDVGEWASDDKQPWTIQIQKREPVIRSECGTKITITELYPDTRKRIEDGTFQQQLSESISRTYAFYLATIVTISLNGKQISGDDIQLGRNFSSEILKIGDVTCSITAGIVAADAGKFRDRSSGWFVFCNGRAVISADKTPLTGWSGSGLPIFQPKHRPFFGTVFFVSQDPEKLPWTTTKAAINEDSSLWQEAKRHMVATGRAVISYLDKRYSDDSTESVSRDLQQAAGKSVSALVAAGSKRRAFEAPKKRVPKDIRIQYSARVSDVRKIAEYLGQPDMGGAEVGRYTFEYFLRNEVGED